MSRSLVGSRPCGVIQMRELDELPDGCLEAIEAVMTMAGIVEAKNLSIADLRDGFQYVDLDVRDAVELALLGMAVAVLESKPVVVN